MAAPSEQERVILPGFRARFSDVKLEDDSDMFLLRWIRAREYNLNQAEDMLKKHLEWRKEYDIDNILTWEPPAEITSEYPVDILGYDEDNCPVAVLAFGRWDLKKVIESGQRNEFIRYVDKLYIQMLHNMKGRVTREGIPVTQFSVVYDMEGLSMKLLTCYGAIDAAMETLKRFESNHPETLKRCYVVNASRLFTMLFAIVKPILSQRTFGKVDVYNSTASKWKPVLLKAIPAKILPVTLGGRNASSIINSVGGKSFKGSMKALNSSTMDNESEGLVKVTVGAGQKIPIEMEILDSNSLLSWSFTVQDFDIGFSLLDDIGEEIISYSRVETKTKSHEGSVISNRVGKYTFVFDNTYSRMRSKVLYYNISVVTPKEKLPEDSPSL